MYEIIIGGWNNTKSAIRHIGKEPAEVVEIPTPNILKIDEMLGFWIRWYDNTISVGHAGEDNSFMSHKAEQLFPIKYVGLSTGFGSSGSWLFDGKSELKHYNCIWIFSGNFGIFSNRSNITWSLGESLQSYCAT